MNREDHLIPSHGETLAAWLYRPSESDGDVGCVVLGHGFTAVRDQRLDAYAERFCAAGLAALVFDYRYLGDSSGQPRGLIEPKRQLEDYHAAIAYARGLDGIDPDRIGIWGTSFSGGHVVMVAAQDPRVAAAVSQCPAMDPPGSVGGLGLVQGLKLTAAGLYDELGSRLGRPIYTIALAANDRLAALPGPETVPGMEAITPPGSKWTNAFSARTILRFAVHRPVKSAPRVTAPLLVCICDHDIPAPPKFAHAAAAAAPRGTAKTYDCGHFDIYVGAWFERAVADQTAFLAEHLGARRPVPVS